MNKHIKTSTDELIAEGDKGQTILKDVNHNLKELVVMTREYNIYYDEARKCATKAQLQEGRNALMATREKHRNRVYKKFETAMDIQNAKIDFIEKQYSMLCKTTQQIDLKVAELDQMSASQQKKKMERNSSCPQSSNSVRPLSSSLGSTSNPKEKPHLPESRASFRYGEKLSIEMAPGEPTSEEEDEGCLYCICLNKAYGYMIACDNPSCKYEWFHYECLDMDIPPQGEWYCPFCIIPQ